MTTPESDENMKALLDAERGFPREPYAAQSGEVFARLERLTSVLSAVPRSSSRGAALRSRRFGARSAVAIAFAALAVGGVAGATIGARRAAVPTTPVPTGAPSASLSPSAIASASAPPLAEDASTEQEAEASRDASVARVHGSTSRPSASDAGPRHASLAAERELIDVARAGVVRNHPEDAMRALDQHRSAFPEGSLAEEREVLAVQALVQLRRYDEARLRAEAFHRRYPTSMLGAAVDASLRSIP